MRLACQRLTSLVSTSVIQASGLTQDFRLAVQRKVIGVSRHDDVGDKRFRRDTAALDQPRQHLHHRLQAQAYLGQWLMLPDFVKRNAANSSPVGGSPDTRFILHLAQFGLGKDEAMRRELAIYSRNARSVAPAIVMA